jgi:multidrug efflux system outer membrane protein
VIARRVAAHPALARRLVGLVTLALTLGGCLLLGPDYRRPAVPTPHDWRTEAKGTGSLADLSWWEFFRDPVLRDLIAIAVEENKDVLIAIARIEQSRAQLAAANAARWPRVDSNSSYSNVRNSPKVFPPVIDVGGVPGKFRFKPEGETFRTTLDLSFELDIWGRLRRASEAARADLLASDEARRTVLLTLVSDLASSYFDLLSLDEQLVVTQRSVDTRRAALRILQARQREGITSDLDVRRAEGELASSAAIVPDTERQIAQLENRISVLLGRNPGPIRRGPALRAHDVPFEVPAGLPSALLDRRPDVRQAEQQLVAANARIGEAKAAFFPQIQLTGSYGVTSFALNQLFTGPARTWQFGPSISVPVFDAGRLSAQLDLAEARQREALIFYQQTIQNAFREVDDALIAHQKNREEIFQQESQAAAYREAVRLSSLRYYSGIGSQFEVLDAQRQLFSAEIAATQTRHDQLLALIQVYKALGGGWPDVTGEARAPGPRTSSSR